MVKLWHICEACLAVLGLLRNSVPSVRQCVLGKGSRELDPSKTSIELANTVCVLLSLNSKQKSIL